MKIDDQKKRNDSFAGLKSEQEEINAGRLWNEINRRENEE